MSPQDLVALTGSKIDPVIVVHEEEFGEFLEWANSYDLEWYYGKKIEVDDPEAVAKKENISFKTNSSRFGFRLDSSYKQIAVNHAPVGEYKNWKEHVQFFDFEKIADPVKTVRGIAESDFDDISAILNNL